MIDEDVGLHNEIKRLTCALASRFPAVAGWQPLPDAFGMLSQMDNMIAAVPQGYGEARSEVREVLRDRFAMAALTGLVANTHLGESITGHAENAYAFADAMLAAREGTR